MMKRMLGAVTALAMLLPAGAIAATPATPGDASLFHFTGYHHGFFHHRRFHHRYHHHHYFHHRHRFFHHHHHRGFYY